MNQTLPTNDELILEEMTVNIAKTHRFWDKLTEDENGCLIWPGALNNGGYGVFRIGMRGLVFSTSPHRVAWMLENERVMPLGHEIDHLCRVRSCCNPDHLEPVTRRENVARANGRSLSAMAPVVRSGPASIHVRRRVRGDRYLLAWRDHLEDGSTVQRGTTYATREEAESARGGVVMSTKPLDQVPLDAPVMGWI